MTAILPSWWIHQAAWAEKKPHRFHGRDRTIEPGEWPKNRNGDAKQLNIGIQCDLMGFNGIQWDIGYL
jgi:hypothetical protein